MATMKSRVELESRSVAEQAAEWLLILEENRADDREAFADWLSRSPEHVRAFLCASAVDEMMRQFDRSKSVEVDLGPFPDGPDIEPAMREEEEGAKKRAWLRGWGLRQWALAASVGVLAILLATLGLSSDEWRHYSAAIGEQRVLQLEDGSTMYLLPGSSVDTRFTGSERRVRLATGEAMFEVFHDKSRPFRVLSGRTIVQAVGTKFSVSRVRGDAVVTVVDGVVEVTRDRSAIEKLAEPLGLASVSVRPVRIEKGQETRVAADGAVSAPKPANVDPVQEWQSRRLTFVNETLFAIAEEFNRFNRSPKIRIEDATAGELTFAAAFDADDPQSLATVLELNPNLVVTKTDAEIVIRSR